MLIHDMNNGDRFEGYYILQNIAQRTTAAGKPFLTLNLVDRSGSVTAQVWDYTGPISQSDVGKVAWIAGLASEYRGAPQVTVHRIRLAEENDDYRVSDLVATAPIQMDETWEWLKETVNSMEDEDYRALCQEMLSRYGKQFRLIPAAKSMHHGFVGGLLMHTAYMVRAACFYAKLYPALDRSLLLSGTLLHDLASGPGGGVFGEGAASGTPGPGRRGCKPGGGCPGNAGGEVCAAAAHDPFPSR